MTTSASAMLTNSVPGAVLSGGAAPTSGVLPVVDAEASASTVTPAVAAVMAGTANGGAEGVFEQLLAQLARREAPGQPALSDAVPEALSTRPQAVPAGTIDQDAEDAEEVSEAWLALPDLVHALLAAERVAPAPGLPTQVCKRADTGARNAAQASARREALASVSAAARASAAVVALDTAGALGAAAVPEAMAPIDVVQATTLAHRALATLVSAAADTLVDPDALQLATPLPATTAPETLQTPGSGAQASSMSTPTTLTAASTPWLGSAVSSEAPAFASAPSVTMRPMAEATVLRETVGSPAWTQELGTELLLLREQGQHSASLKLTPEHLGPLEVRIAVHEGEATLQFAAPHADTRAALEQAIPRLRELFAAQGLVLADAGIFQGGARHGPASAAAHRSDARDARAEPADSGSTPVARRIGLVDTYA